MSKLKVSHADMVAITKCQAYIRGYLQMEEFKKMSMSHSNFNIKINNIINRGMDSC